MEVTPTGLVLLPVALLALLALLWTVVVIQRAALSPRPISECILAAGVVTVLTLNAEAHLLSFLPLARPLDWLPHFHTLLTLGLIGYALRVYGVAPWRESVRALFSGAGRLLREAGRLLVITLIGVSALLLVYLAFGAYSVPNIWDELEYHVPMAVQPYQDGRVDTITSDLPWANAYPRGVELVWYWTLQWTGTDVLFHPVQLAFGLQLLLATYVLARRTGAAARAALLATAVLATMPVFCVLSTTGYIDLAVAAALISLLAFLAPSRQPGRGLTQDWPVAALAFAQACLVKLPILAVMFAGLALLENVFFRASWRQGLREAGCFLRLRRVVPLVLIIAASCHTYWKNWFEHANPLYPVAVNLAGREVFPGPINPGLFGGGGHTTVNKPVLKMSRWERFYHAWTDFDQPLDVDSFGGFGPVLPYAILVPFLAFAVASVLRFDSWRLTLTALFALCLLTPAFLPRYGLPMVTIAVVGAMWLLGRFRGAVGAILTLVVLGLCVPGAVTSAASMHARISWIRCEAGGRLPLWSRDAFVAEKWSAGKEHHCSPQMTAFIRAHSGPGDLLVWNVRTFPTLLWNLRYSNRVRHLPGTAGEMYPGTASALVVPTEEELTRWLEQIDRLRPRHVLVYARSAYARRLLGDSAPPYCVAFRDPTQRGAAAMILFERRTDGSAHGPEMHPPPEK